METPLESARAFDHEKFLEDCDDEPSFVSRYLNLFVKVTQDDIDGIAVALGENDFKQVSQLAHRIKGASASIRAEFLREEAARLEHLSGKGESAAAGECFARLRAEFEHFKKFIAALPLAIE
jgi:two-component system, sensor histidine kinase and response regulator